MKHMMLAVIAATGLTVTIAPAFAGNCDHSYENAKDGSSCGDRAADRRAGGQ